MARDLNQLFDDLRNSREVYVTQDGNVERADEAADNADFEERRNGRPKARTQLKPEIFGGEGHTVSVAEGVFSQAHALAQKYPGETGAIGVGPDEHTVTELIPSGPNAKRSSGSFELDADYLQPKLDAAERRGLRFNLFWHSHPEGCSEPSGTDRAAARRMLRDPDWGLSGRLLLPISVRTRTGFSTRFFVAEGKDARIREVSVAVLSTPAGSGLRALTRLVDEASDGRGPRAARHVRLEKDQADLRAAGWTVSLRDAGTRRALRLEVATITLWLVLPPEYPLSPPDAFVEELGKLCPIPVADTPELVPWSSMRSLVALAAQAKKSIEDLREVEALIVRPWRTRLVRHVPIIGRAFPSLQPRSL